MRVEREEAVSIFRKWLVDASTLLCSFSSPFLKTGCEGKIVFVSDVLVILKSEDGAAEAKVALDLAVSFGFDDTRETPRTAAVFDFGVTVFFDEPLEVESPRVVVFLEKRL